MMNRSDAAAILNIDPSASPEEARRAYQELFTEHQFRLTNAPTPALRSLYQGRLRELDEARDVLLAAPPADAVSDLPTDQPSIPDKPAPVSREPIETASAAESTRQPRKPVEVETPKPQPTSRETPRPVSKDKSGRTRNIALGMIGIVLIIVGLIKLVPAFTGGNNKGSDSARSVAPATPAPGYSDSVRAIRENLAVARVEFTRAEPDYAAINKALGDADRIVASLPAAAGADTTVARLKIQLAQQHSSVRKSCDFLKRMAQQRGEPIPNCGG